MYSMQQLQHTCLVKGRFNFYLHARIQRERDEEEEAWDILSLASYYKVTVSSQSASSVYIVVSEGRIGPLLITFMMSLISIYMGHAIIAKCTKLYNAIDC